MPQEQHDHPAATEWAAPIDPPSGIRISTLAHVRQDTIFVAQSAWATEAGIERLRTENRTVNPPIRALDDALGYRPLPARIILRGPVDP